MKEYNRREFLKYSGLAGIATSGLMAGDGESKDPDEKIDIGLCKKLTITSISEVGWWDNQQLLSDAKAGGSNATQWEIYFDRDNSAGSSSLIEMEDLEGKYHKFLLDTGWNVSYMDKRFQKMGVDRMLRNGEIEFLYISHEHLDHLWGLEATLKYKPDIKIIVPSTFKREAYHLMRGTDFMFPGVRNEIHHEGELKQLKPGGIHELLDGYASVTFDVPIGLGIRGEQSLYFNVKDKGIVCVTGCCHQTITAFAEYAQKYLLGGENLYGLYGGLHSAPFGILTPDKEKMIIDMEKFGFQKIAANHCTGLAAVKKMIELGYPVVRGTGQFGSKSDLYVGNGDSVTFG